MPSEPDWLTADDIIELNELIVDGSDERHLVLKPNELDSAIQRPRSLYVYEGVDEIGRLAVRLMIAICQNHPFEEGNKRTGFIAATIFVLENGHIYEADDDEAFAELLKSVIKREASEEELIAAFSANLYQTV